MSAQAPSDPTADETAGAVAREVRVLDLSVTVFESGDVDRDLDEAIALGRAPPYGRVLWPSAHHAASLLAARPLAGVQVLELGAGCGLVSLVCALRGARVRATDTDERALAWIARSAATHGVTIDTARFDVLADAALPPASLVVIADLLYEEHLARAVARRVLEAHARGSDVLVCDPGRVSRPVFLRELAGAGVDARFEGEPVGALVLAGRGA